MEKDSTKQGGSVCPVGTGRTVTRDWPQEPGGRRSAWRCRAMLHLEHCPYCEVLACPLSPSSLRHKQRLQRWNHTVVQADLMSVLAFGCTSQILLFCVEGFWHPCLKQVYWRHFPRGVCSLCVSASQFGNGCSISNAPPAKR